MSEHPKTRALTPEDKREVIEGLLQIWEDHPQLRLGQLIANAYITDQDLSRLRVDEDYPLLYWLGIIYSVREPG